MLKVLIADDEIPIREWLEFSIKKLKQSDIEIYSAGNGEEALNIFNKQLPHLVILDIIMPGIDGVELLRQIKQKKPSTHVVMLTSHEDFDLVRNSLNNHADKYILKSEVSSENLRHILDDMVNKNFNISVRINQHAENFIDEQIDSFFVNLSISQPKSSYCVIAVYSHYQPPIETYLQKNEMQFSLLPISKKIFCILVIQPKIPSQLYQMSKYHHLVTDIAEACMGPVGSSGLANSHVPLADSIRRSIFALALSFYQENPQKKQVYTNCAKDFQKQYSAYQNHFSKIISIILEKKYKEAVQQLFEFLSNIEMETPFFIDNLRGMLTEIINQFRLAALQYNQEFFQQELIQLKKRIYLSTSFTQLKKEIEAVFSLHNLQELYKSASYSDYIQVAMQEITKNYKTINRVTDVSDKLNINMEYFCRIFKREVGSTFINYLTRYRMQEAHRLLSTGHNISNTAAAVGYKNIYYFSKLFKKEFGVTPSSLIAKKFKYTKQT